MNRLKALCVLTILSVLLGFGIAAANEAQNLYKDYLSSYQKYSEALKNDLPESEVKARYAECVEALENYKRVSGDTLTIAPVQAPAEAAAPAPAVEAASGNALRGGQTVSVPVPAGKAKNDRLIAELEERIARTSNSEQANLLKLELAGHYANLRGDYEKANALLKEVGSATRNSAIAKKAADAIKANEKKALQQNIIKNIYAAKDKSKQAYAKYSNLKWSSPVKKIGALGSYYISLFSYRKQVGDYKEFKKENETEKQRALLTDWSFDAATDSEVSPGNDITLLLNGKKAFAKRHELAELAQSYIYLQYLSY
ncbi:MAG TPA: hypothetical protein PK467_05820, partial [Candidatus Wallbacteria bacterium]|nr:hypothetical protein [Candidatus Wallbacteria bacterium]